jgi:hypothetical protein
MILGVGLSAGDLPQQTFEIAVCRDQDEVVSGGVLQNPPNRRHEQARFGARFRSQRSNSRPKTGAVMPLTAIAPEYRSGIMAGLATPVFWKWCSVAFQAAMPPFVGAFFFFRVIMPQTPRAAHSSPWGTRFRALYERWPEAGRRCRADRAADSPAASCGRWAARYSSA